MQNISIVASGSRGDVQPYVALGKGLRNAGYSVRLLTSDDFEALVTEAGLGFASTGSSTQDRVQGEEWQQVMESGNFLKIMAKMRTELKKAGAKMAQKLPPLIEGSDLVVTGMAGIGGTFSIAERFGIPLVETHVFPFTPTRAFPSPLVPKLPLGRLLNSLSFQVTRQLFWQNFRGNDGTMRKTLGMSRPPFWGPFRKLEQMRVPLLYGYSPHVLPRPGDWPASHHVTGYWFLDEPASWSPPADLVDFLEAGEPPVYIGFGSMGSRNPEEAGRIALGALARAGQRGVIAAGWGGLSVDDLPETVHAVGELPHSWLFPRMAAVVHHGGAGTTAAGVRAGVPSIIVPFMGDQPFWGQRVVDLGVGPAPIPRKQLTAERLGDAITQATADAGTRQRAAELGRQIRAENGVERAVHLIKQFDHRFPNGDSSSSCPQPERASTR